jgi:hypothetical protein
MVMFFPVGVNFIQPGGGGGGNDPYADNVVLFLKGEGVIGSASIIDSSQTPKVINNNGLNPAIISGDQSRLGTSSILFNSSRLSTANSLDLALGTGDFTAELWLFRTGGSNLQAVIISGDWTEKGLYILESSVVYYNFGVQASGGPIINNQWNHVAMSRLNGVITIFLNGIPLTSANVADNYDGLNFILGRSGNIYHDPFAGYMERVRVTKGVARYTANFNPETDTYL